MKEQQPITIQETAKPKKSNHKEYGNEKTHSPDILLRWINGNGYKINFDLWTQGGIIYTKTANKPSGYVRPPLFRQDKMNPDVTRGDVRPVTTENKQDNELSLAQQRKGKELELLAFDPKTGETISIMNDADPFYKRLRAADPEAKQLGWTRESLSNCIELDLGNGKDAPLEALSKLKNLINLAEESNVGIAPLANMPHRKTTPADVTDGEYNSRMNFDVQTWAASQHYDITSQQHHFEILDHKAARQTLNHIQFVTPILLASTLCGPFTEGKIEADLQDKYKDAPGITADPLKEETLAQLGTGTRQSYRTFGRFFGSPSGGILREPIPIEEEAFYPYLEKRLKDGEIPSAGRAGGHHTDRYRPDILPHGTIELCGLDPAGGKIEKIAAMGEFSRALGWKMQMHFKNGTFDEKAQEYKALFGTKPSEEAYETAHWNSLKVAKEGTNAIVKGMDGEDYSIKVMWEQLKKFVQEPLVDKKRNIDYQGVPAGIIQELDNAFVDPSKVYDNFRDENGYTSTKGFYETGIGNLSEWMIQGARERMDDGVNEKQAIMAVTVDVAKNFHDHIKQTTPNTLNALYR